MSASPTPTSEEFSLAKDGEQEDAQVKVQAQNASAEQVSAADYDPNLDRRHEEERRARGTKDEPMLDVEEIEEIEEDDVDDMFAVTTDAPKVKKVKKVIVSDLPHTVHLTHVGITLQKKTVAPALITTTLDSAADPEGYYQVILGEQLDGGRYQVFSSLGKGMFANVVRARILQGEPGEVGKEVAIKIIRCQESMFASIPSPSLHC